MSKGKQIIIVVFGWIIFMLMSCSVLFLSGCTKPSRAVMTVAETLTTNKYISSINTPEEAASYLKQHSTEYGIVHFHYRCEKEDTGSDTTNSFYLKQLHNEIPLDNGWFRIYTDKSGNVKEVNGHYEEPKVTDTRPEISSDEAINRSGIYDVRKVGLLITNGGTTLAWEVNAKDESYCIIDAKTGEVIKRGSRRMTLY